MARQLTNPRFRHGEHARNVFQIVPELGTTMEEILSPLYLANVSAKLRVGDRIEVLQEDYGGFAELLVRRVEHGSVVTALLFSVAFDEAEEIEAPEPDYRVEFTGAQSLWRVVRIADGVVVKDGVQTEAAAKRWLTNHLKTL